MKKIFVFIICSSPLIHVFAQVAGEAQGKGMDMQTSPGGFIKQLPMAPAETKGDVYLNSEWSLANITLFNQNADELKEYPVRVNLQTNDIEINYQNQVKVLSGRAIKYFTLKKSDGAQEKYVNGKRYKLNDVPMAGFLKVVDSSKWELVSKTQLKVIQASYVSALDAGDRSDKIVKEEIFYFSKDATLYQVYPSSKKFAVQFKENSELVKNFIKTNDLNLKNQLDLHQIQVFLSESL